MKCCPSKNKEYPRSLQSKRPAFRQHPECVSFVRKTASMEDVYPFPPIGGNVAPATIGDIIVNEVCIQYDRLLLWHPAHLSKPLKPYNPATHLHLKRPYVYENRIS